MRALTAASEVAATFSEVEVIATSLDEEAVDAGAVTELGADDATGVEELLDEAESSSQVNRAGPRCSM